MKQFADSEVSNAARRGNADFLEETIGSHERRLLEDRED
jgi:hypothetical protein